ncbi:uncharacterized protein LOC120359363 [Solenopsis invicta]|uniref:uncharacterized protein LOC120359363 n=1 Tax=Solenopsis invicta TaxID=13686 RepID=UPI00193E666A|nr:uncharacterized protein LOC120359363 [Solenopsis invicta]
MDLVEPERNRLEVITSRSETPKLNEQIGVKTETEDITDKLNKELMKRKSALIKVKSIKRNKICPNLNMARNKVSGKENKDSTNVQTTDNANNSLIVALHENNALRIEIENLKKTIERYQRGQDSIPQVTVQNRFMALDTEIPSQMEAEETEQQDKDFVTILRRKNSQDNNGNKKKEKAENNNTIKDQHIANKAEIDTTHYEKDENDNILINKLTDKLNILGAHFAGINNNKMENNSPHLNNIINKETKNFFDKIQNERSNGTTIYINTTIHAINRLTSDINWALNGKKCLGACLIDLEKAFDTVWLEGLLFKLIKKGFPDHIIKLIWSMISSRSIITENGGTYSDIVFKINNGLQQGIVNSPILFNIYTAEVLKLFNLNTPKNPQAIAFADDLIVYVADSWPSKIQELTKRST